MVATTVSLSLKRRCNTRLRRGLAGAISADVATRDDKLVSLMVPRSSPHPRIDHGLDDVVFDIEAEELPRREISGITAYADPTAHDISLYVPSFVQLSGIESDSSTSRT